MRKHFDRRLFAVLILAVLCPALATAMTVIPPSFPELVAESSTIVRGRVTELSARKVAGARGAMIKTFVTFRVSSALKGANQNEEITLSFLGGQVGDERLEVPGMPAFDVGAEDYLFITTTGGICPLVGAMHGRYRLITPQKEGRPYVARDDHAPLVRVSDVIKPMQSAGSLRALSDGSSALTPQEFEKLVVAEIKQPSGRARP